MKGGRAGWRDFSGEFAEICEKEALFMFKRIALDLDYFLFSARPAHTVDTLSAN
jgi:hypothetical protein